MVELSSLKIGKTRKIIKSYKPKKFIKNIWNPYQMTL